MSRITVAFVTVLVQLVVVAMAQGATISISPTSGPVGTVVSFQGVASECDEEAAADAEVFMLLGDYSGSASVNPRTLVELDQAGAFSGTWAMPDPVESFARDSRSHSVPISVRCVGATGDHDGPDITPSPATFTFTSRPSVCGAFGGARADGSLDGILGTIDSCLRDACANLVGTQSKPSANQGTDAQGNCLALVLRGTDFANRLIGNVLANVLEGRAGDDVLRGLGGNDVIRGGAGNDHATGDGGNDRITGGAGVDVQSGGAGNDTINSNDSRPGDTVVGGPGTDTCVVNEGDVVRSCERVRVR